MFFRNLTFFVFGKPTSHALDISSRHGVLQEVLSPSALKPVGTLELASRGFVSPLGGNCEALLHRVGDAIWLCLGGETRMLPASVVNTELAKKIAEVEAKDGRKLGGRARKRLKEDLVHELLPKAFVKPSRLNGYLDLKRGFFAVDTASRKQAEAFVSEVRHALGSFPAVPVNAEVDPRGPLTGWLAGERMPEGLALSDECVLKDPIEGGAVVRCAGQELISDEISEHLGAGKQCARLRLNLDDHVEFTLCDDLVVRKLKFLDGAVDALEDTERDSLIAELDARFALMSGEVGRLFDGMSAWLQVSKAES